MLWYALKIVEEGGKNSNIFCSNFTRVKCKSKVFLMTFVHFSDKKHMPQKMQMEKENYEQGEKLIDYRYYEKVAFRLYLRFFKNL